MDYAHAETDKAIEELEKRLQAEYRQAYRETKGKLEKYLSDFARKDEAKRKLVDEGKLSQADYKKWRTNQMLTGQRWVKMVDTLAKDMNRTNQIAADIISGNLKGTFALNANFAAYGIENGFQTDFGFTLYNEDTVNRLIEENPDLLPAPKVDIPEDIRWNKQKITSNITQAVLQGKSIPEIAKTMQTVVGMNKASATRNARTAMTGAQNAGRQQAYDRAKTMGIKVKKEWIATLDGRTRHSHGMADGQQVEIDGKFKVGASELRYPGDPQGAAEEVYNCRCTMATVEPPEILRGEEPRMTYQEWVQTKEGQETLEKAVEKNKTTKDLQKQLQNNLESVYNRHNQDNNLNRSGAGGALNPVSVNLGNLSAKTSTAFAETLENLTSRYDTPLATIRQMDREEAFLNQTVFARVTHNYEIDTSELIINPIKCAEYEKMTSRLKELVEKKYIVAVRLEDVDKYIATHEFAHTLANMAQPLQNSRNWVNADYAKIKKFRKEIQKQFDKYVEDVTNVEKLYRTFESKVYFEADMSDENFENLAKYKKLLDTKKLSKYSLTNADEFMAEAFAHSELSDKDNEYATEVRKIIDKYFAR